MRTHTATPIERSIASIKKKAFFSFLNVAGVLLLTGALITSFQLGQVFHAQLKNKSTTFLNTKVSHDLTYIKPFTSLVGFNWKFRKDTKRRDKNIRNSLAIPIINYKVSF